MPLSRETVDHVAMLARLGLTDEERDRLADELGKIIDHVSQLERVDTSAVPVTAQVGDIVNAWRDDVSRPSIGADKALANAPEQDESCFRVGAIQDE